LRDYEILYIVRPDFEDDKVQDVVKRVNTLISRSGGSSEQTSLWGKRKLAYEVKHQKEGSYVLQDFTIDPGRVPELENALKITEDVMRHIIVRRQEKSASPTAAPSPADGTAEPATRESRSRDAADAPDGDREER
jgi:small subunit ribosomal protein S6